MKILLAVFAIFLLSLSSQNSIAQPAKPVKFTKYTPPKLFTSIGVLKDSSTAPVDQVKALLAQKLTIKDAGGTAKYSIQSYHFVYRKRIVSEDEAGNAVPGFSISAKQMYNSDPLPATWVESMREQLLPGEELFFFDIIVKDEKGRIMYAPTLKIFVVK